MEMTEGEDWTKGHKLVKIVLGLPKFICEMVAFKETDCVVGEFKLGAVYNVAKYN